MTLEDDKEILMYISFYLSQTPSPGTNLSLPPSLLPSPDWRDLYHLVRDNLGGGGYTTKAGVHEEILILEKATRSWRNRI